jgi:hypothetical protein
MLGISIKGRQIIKLIFLAKVRSLKYTKFKITFRALLPAPQEPPPSFYIVYQGEDTQTFRCIRIKDIAFVIEVSSEQLTYDVTNIKI